MAEDIALMSRAKGTSTTAYIRATHHYSFRSGQWARITGVVYATPKGYPTRPCYTIRFIDGKTDEWPIDDPQAGYEFSGYAL